MGGYGATVARLTPDQKVGSSNLSALICVPTKSCWGGQVVEVVGGQAHALPHTEKLPWGLQCFCGVLVRVLGVAGLHPC